MIKEKCFTKDWMESFKKQKVHRQVQGQILEKMIHALYLLQLLKVYGLDFVFKGGTSLVLLLNAEKRFSIDIDIICLQEQAEIERILNLVVSKSSFKIFVLDKRRSYKSGIPKAHYIFDFECVYNPNVPGKILLDILLDESIYPEIIASPISTKWIESEDIISVTTPTIDSIAGDKLTAFAPNTIGIPYYKGENSFTMQICKQLFDLSKLFNEISNMNTVNKSFQAFAKKEIGYRNHYTDFEVKEVTPEKVLQDILGTCLLITKRNHKEEPYKTQFADIEKGIRAFGSAFLMTGKFRIEDAVSAAAKVAHLTAKLIVGELSPIQFYNGEDIKQLSITNPDWIFLNKLKKQPDKSSFYYWYQTVQLLSQ